jgi:hypothetical protein
MIIDYEQYGKRVHVFWEDSIGNFIKYLCLCKLFADKIYVISHTFHGYDVQFLLRRFLELGWIPQLILGGSKILNISVENLNFVESQRFANEFQKTFDLTCKKRYYTHFFNMANNSDYVCPHPETKYYGAHFMSGDERAQFLDWYEEQKDKRFRSK